MKLLLTDLSIKRLPNPEIGQVTYWDKKTPGFGLRCSVKSKSFVIMHGAKRQLKTLGRYPNTSLQIARKQAKLFLSLEPTQFSDIPSVDFDVAVELFLEDCAQRLRPSTIEGYRLYLTTVQLHGPLSKISRSTILNKLDFWKTRPSSQNHAFTAIKVFLNWCLRKDFVSVNPLAPMKRPHGQISRDRVLSNSELSTLLVYTFANDDRFSRIVSLLAFTGQRRGEIATLEWKDIDEDVLRLPPSRTKNKKPHEIPLGKRSMTLLGSKEGKSPFVFAHPTLGTPFCAWAKAKKKMDAELGIEKFTLHDLRRTFSTIHARIGTPIHVTERLLNHQSGSISGVVAIYNRHSYMGEMQSAMVQYDKYLEKLINS